MAQASALSAERCHGSPALLPGTRTCKPCALVLRESEGVYQTPAKLRLLDQVREAIRTLQELLGHRDVKTTLVYTHVLNRGGHGVQSPADRLLAGRSAARLPAGPAV